MFDKNYFSAKKEYIPYVKEVNVNENRAPTDESIRIYDEIKEKAFKSIIDTIEINDNSFNIKATIARDPYTYEIVCRYLFILNGREIEGTIREREYRDTDKHKMLKKILDEASRHLAYELVHMLIRGTNEGNRLI